MAENLAITDFQLSDDQMQKILALNENRRFADPGYFV
jgi:diketogulonate reductase-like aldo/keto reductase